MNFIFLMEPLHTVVVEKDTTLLLMVGAHAKGHKTFYLPDGGMTLNDGKIHFHVIEVTPQLKKDNPFIDQKSHVLSEDDVDCLFIRSDPPFDSEYLFNTWLLDHVKDRIAVINNPDGIRNTNEKLWATQFVDIVPPTMIGRNHKDLKDFLETHKDCVTKPTDGFGGQSVFHVKKNERNTNVIIETLTDHFKKDIVMQKFIPASKEGDKRILLLEGEPLGAVLRMHSEDDHRNNFFSGGKPLATEINKRDEKIISVLKPHLLKQGLYLVGIDIIGDYLTEVNVTSPTCMQEMNNLYNVRLEEKVIAFAEKYVAQIQS